MTLSTPAHLCSYQRSICPNSSCLCRDGTHLVLSKAKEVVCSKSFSCRSTLHCKIKPLIRLDSSQVPAHGTVHCSVCPSLKREVHPPHRPVTEQSFFLSAHRKLFTPPCSWMPHQTLQDIRCHRTSKGAECPVT